jgi:hypothetical protein
MWWYGYKLTDAHTVICAHNTLFLSVRTKFCSKIATSLSRVLLFSRCTFVPCYGPLCLLELKAAVADLSKHFVVCCDYNFSKTALLPFACEKCCYYALASVVRGFMKFWFSDVKYRGLVSGLVRGVRHKHEDKIHNTVLYLARTI